VRRGLIAFAIVACVLGRPRLAGAHRLDEYLQATLLSIDADRIGVELALTAGTNVAAAIFASIDVDGDGRLSRDEADAYARQVLSAIDLFVDGRPARLALEDSRFPDFAEMSDGTGTIRLQAAAKLPAMTLGRHELAYRNGHRPDGSVYLVNTLVPADPRIEVSVPSRDELQRSIVVDYRVGIERSWARAAWLLIGVAMIGTLVIAKRSG